MRIVLKRILVPTDLTDRSRPAVGYGVALVEEFGASLHLLHVIDALAVEDPIALPLKERAQIQRNAERVAGIALRQLLNESERLRLRPVLAVEAGEPVAEIIRYARTHAIDLIVGNLSARLAQRAPCPFLALHHPEREFVLPQQPGRRKGARLVY
jgi:nucleotide-binding universal stress UspA family protein